MKHNNKLSLNKVLTTNAREWYSGHTKCYFAMFMVFGRSYCLEGINMAIEGLCHDDGVEE